MEIKEIKKINVDDRSLTLLQKYKEEQFNLKKEIYSGILPLIAEDIKQIRELTLNIAIISGAIAAFTIPVLYTRIIQLKSLGYLSVIFLFITICYAIYHLSEIIPKELNELSKQLSVYSTLLDESVNRINEVIKSGNISKLTQFDKSKLKSRLKSLKPDLKPDKSLNNLRMLLFLALLLLTLSFIPVDFLIFIKKI